MEGFHQSQIEQKDQIINNKNFIQDCDVIENLNDINKNLIQVQSFMNHSSNKHQEYQIYKDKNESSNNEQQKNQQNISHLNSSDILNSIIDLDSTKNLYGKKQGILFLDVQSRTTYFKDHDNLVEDKNGNQSINNEKMQLKYNHNNIYNKSFLSENIEIEETEESLCNNPSKEVKSIVMKQQLRHSRDTYVYTENMNTLKQQQQYFYEQLILIRKQKSCSKIINPLQYRFEIDLEKLIGKYDGDDLQIKQQQLKRKFEDYFANKKCKCIQVLLVDDMDLNFYILELKLKYYGIDADKAMSGDIAINCVEEKAQSVCCQHYKLIFMDIAMPCMDGYYATKVILYLCKEKFNVKPPIIGAYSSFYISSERDKAKEAGMKFYLQKPIIDRFCIDIILEYCILKQ